MGFRLTPARNWFWPVAVLMFLVVALAPASVLARQFQTINRISVSSTGVQGINIQHPVINGDGSVVAFWSDHEGLVPADTNFAGDVFVRLVNANQTIRVSLGHGGVQTARTDGNLPNSYPDIDIDDSGCIIVYSSDAMNITQQGGTQVPDVNNTTDVFAVDRCIPGFPTSGFQTLHVSKRYIGAGGNQANGGNTNPKVSGSGQFIAWRSAANNLVDGDTNNAPDIFIMDRQAAGFPISRVNLANNEDQANIEDGTMTFSLSDDGLIVAFASVATNLVGGGDFNNLPDIFIRNRPAGTTIRVKGVGGAEPNGASTNPVISGNGRYVVFRSNASNLVLGDTNGHPDIFRYDINTDTIERVSLSSEGVQPNFGSDHPSISDNGRFVSFYSDASNLVFSDTNGSADIFVRDMDTQITTRAHVRQNGNQANGPANRFSALSDTASYIAFESYATNLVDGDTNATSDVFIGEAGPNSPSNLRIVDKGTTFVNLAWDDHSGNEESMIVQRRTEAQANFSTRQTLPANTTTFNDTALTTCTVYYYRVLSEKDDIKSSSNILKVKTLGCPPGSFKLQNPILGETVINPERLEFRWQSSEEAATYNFVLTRVGFGVVENRVLNHVDICDANRCTVEVDGALLSDLINANFTWTVSATNPIGTTNASNNAEGYFTVNDTLPPRDFDMYVPAHRTLIRDPGAFQFFAWQDNKDAASYRLTVIQVSNNIRLGTLIDHTALTPEADGDDLSCDFVGGVCYYLLTSGEQDAMADGRYTWTVTANSPGGGEFESTDGAFRFTVNSGDIELLANPGFESDSNADGIADGWTFGGLSGDKRKCNKLSKTFTIFGDCAFELKGSSTESSSLSQTLTDTGYGFVAGDELHFSMQAKAANLPGNSVKVKITVKYAGGAFPADKATIKVPGGTYDWNPTPTSNTIIDGTVNTISVKITSAAASGKVMLDEVSLLLLGADSPRRRGVEGVTYQEGSRMPVGTESGDGSLLPPPPPPVDGFRGQN